MADVQPFRGLRYNLEQIENLSSVITPPYDVISPDQQNEYYRKNPYKFIRVEFGKAYPDDTQHQNKYTRAAKTLAEWMQGGILIREERPAFYLVEQRFPHRDGYRSSWGLTAAVRLEELGAGRILPTERTMGAPIQDRLSLLRACRANPSPIMGVFEHEEGDLLSLFPDIASGVPSATALDDFGVSFKVWIVNDETIIRRICDFFADREICIADGHHRYTTALAYRNEMAAYSSSGDEAYNYVMMTLISSGDTGLALFPVHRLVKNIDPSVVAGLRDELSRHFHIQELSPVASDASANLASWTKTLEGAGEGNTAFGVYGLAGEKFWLMTANDESSLRETLPKDKPAPWRKLDVSLLHWGILQGMLGIDSPEKENECLQYSSEGVKVLRQVDEGTSQLAFFLNPVPGPDFLAVAYSGAGMPPKSTYFYPKTPAGLVVNPLF